MDKVQVTEVKVQHYGQRRHLRCTIASPGSTTTTVFVDEEVLDAYRVFEELATKAHAHHLLQTWAAV